MDPNVTASFIKNKRTTLERIEKYISDTYFTDINLFGKLYPHKKEVLGVSHWQVPGGEGKWQEWDIASILRQMADFSPVKIGDVFGPSWSTHWFLIYVVIPTEWEGKEVRLRWKSQSEAMIWDIEGRPLQGLSSGTSHQLRTDFCISKCWNAGKEYSHQSYLIEMVCSRMFGLGCGGMINPPSEDEKFILEMVEVCVFDADVYSLLIDLQVLHDLAKHLSDDQRGYRALYAANQMINDLIADKMSHAKEVSREFFSKDSGDCSLTLALIGNCHIDSAWLWPYSETKRKCARSWASTIRLMEDYPEMVFACSQAQQLEWVKETYPDLFSKIREKSRAGRFVHVGATWVEMDGLIPSGESFMRQFLYGQKFFEKEFGSMSSIFWLPDTFGYSGQIPQICKHFGIPFFLTQKLCWNLVNKFPHHTFVWEGIDGSSVLAHFPSGDSYELNVKVEEALKTERNLNDKGRVSIAGFLYGYGDGGGGPTQDMLERARRLANVDGCPRMEHMNPEKMFKQMASEQRNLCRWVGELYLEMHNGTYTSQATTKLYNRRCEFELRNAEFLLAVLTSFKRATSEEIEKMRGECATAWKKVLLNQFHDVLPGSSIGLVYRDSDKLYAEARDIAKSVYEFCIGKLSEGSASSSKSDGNLSVINFLPCSVTKVVELSEYVKTVGLSDEFVQETTESQGKTYVAIEAPPHSYTTLKLDVSSSESVSSVLREVRLLHPPSILVAGCNGEVRSEHSPTESETEAEVKDRVETSNGLTLQNQFIQASLTKYGEVVVLKDEKNGSRNVFENIRDPHHSKFKGNLITLYDDVPLFWDAWDVMDYHLETRKILNTENNDCIHPLRKVESGPLRVEIQLDIFFGKGSSLRQKIIMTAVDPFLTFENEVEWKEAHKFLKVEFETGLLARNASYDIQFGHIQRPTHKNTSWDSAKFEVCGHKWANISEYDCGLSVLNDSKYGWSASGGTLALSLLRAPKAPDEQCDMGKHVFRYAVMPHKGSLQKSGTMEASYVFNSPLSIRQERPAFGGISRWLEIIGEGVMIESVKVAETSDKAIVIRLYEMYGGSRTVWLQIAFPTSEVWNCNGMEDMQEPLTIFSDFLEEEVYYRSRRQDRVQIHFHPFQIRTIQLIL